MENETQTITEKYNYEENDKVRRSINERMNGYIMDEYMDKRMNE